ncbi:hypothetical protein HF690_00125 [Oleiagrimonas citrea]|uniref:Pyocin activator protein PrtN n=1 Tax=Oleiagrimonas citrea TaxID=1665687 RepID=A0A846ZHB6_9GAMM|nr:hypothetical protein [Oleiagrimonas citrea]
MLEIPSTLAELLERDLLTRYGSPLLGGDDLRSALGYPSIEALRQAIARGTVPVPVFSVAHRRGKFALVKDVAIWLAALRQTASDRNEEVPMD